jgi:hypothetical protein
MSDLLSMTSGLAKLFRAVAFTLLLRHALRRKKPCGAWIYFVNSRGTHADDPSRELSAPVSIDRRPEHVLDPRGAARQHDKAVDAERDARALRHAMGESSSIG